MITVYFDLVDSSEVQLYTKLRITPYGTPVPYSGSVVSSDAIHLHYHQAPVTASLVPNTYACTYLGRDCESQFLITLPSSSDGGTVTASNCIVGIVPYPNFTSSCAQSLVPISGSFQVVNGVPQIWDSAQSQWLQLVCFNGILGVT